MLRKWSCKAIVVVGMVLCVGSMILVLSPLPIKRDDIVFVPEGTTLKGMVDSLEVRSALFFPTLWRLGLIMVAKLYPLRVHIGSYRLSPNLTHGELLLNILQGRNRLCQRVTVIEGAPAHLVASLIARAIDTDSSRVIYLISSDTLARAWHIDGAPSLEGYIFPATYELFIREPAEHALARTVQTFERVWSERFAHRARQVSLTRHQIITLASIVEHEVADTNEYRRIAGVYWNRLRNGMKLEADPTVRYALDFPKRRLRYLDYKIDHPYNTYRIEGLPPGPVGVPSAAAIDAVLSPELHDYLYFCRSSDGSKRHSFARTFREHKANVVRYHRMLAQMAANTRGSLRLQ